MTVLDLLVAARALIAHPDHWTRGALARNWRRAEVYQDAPDAVRWCALGAMKHTYAMCAIRPRCLVEALDALGGVSRLVHTNDNKGHAAVLVLFDAAIEKLKKELPEADTAQQISSGSVPVDDDLVLV